MSNKKVTEPQATQPMAAAPLGAAVAYEESKDKATPSEDDTAARLQSVPSPVTPSPVAQPPRPAQPTPPAATAPAAPAAPSPVASPAAPAPKSATAALFAPPAPAADKPQLSGPQALVFEMLQDALPTFKGNERDTALNLMMYLTEALVFTTGLASAGHEPTLKALLHHLGSVIGGASPATILATIPVAKKMRQP